MFIEPVSSEFNRVAPTSRRPIAENILVTAMKQMADKLVLAVKIQRVVFLQALHLLGKAVRPSATVGESDDPQEESYDEEIKALRCIGKSN